MSKESYLRTGGSRSRNEVFLRINDDALVRNLVLRLFSQTKTALLRSAGKPLISHYSYHSPCRILYSNSLHLFFELAVRLDNFLAKSQNRIKKGENKYVEAGNSFY